MNPEESEPPVYNLHLALTLYARESRAPFPLRRKNLMEIVRNIDGDAARLEADGRLAAERVPDADGELAWTRGELVFRGAPVAEVAAAVRRWYGVELRIADPALAGRHLTTSFASDSRERVLHVIALALGARVELRGDTAILTSSDSGGR